MPAWGTSRPMALSIISTSPRSGTSSGARSCSTRRGRASGERGLSLLQWGLIPSWADDPTIGNRLINARAETVAEKPAFRTAFKKRRCLVVADGFYEFIWTIPIPLPLRRGSGRSHRAQPRHDTRTSPAEFKNASVWRTDAQAKTTTNE